jgi:hypothetical protein
MMLARSALNAAAAVEASARQREGFCARFRNKGMLC